MNEIQPQTIPLLPFDWSAAATPPGGRNAEAVRAAAQQFEALLVGQMLRSMREAGGGGWLGGDEQDAAFSLMEMAEQALAAALAAQGGLGLARLVENALSANSSGGGDAEPSRAGNR